MEIIHLELFLETQSVENWPLHLKMEMSEYGIQCQALLYLALRGILKQLPMWNGEELASFTHLHRIEQLRYSKPHITKKCAYSSNNDG